MTTTKVPVGKFVVITKVDDISDTPIMHVSLVTKEVRLEWRSLDRRVVMFLRDDGATLEGGFELSKPDLSAVNCASYGGNLYAYNSPSALSKQWLGKKGKPFKGFVVACARAVSAQRVAEYGTEFDSAAPDFLPALAAMKTAAQQQFGDWQRRCIRFAPRRGPDDLRCTRYSSGPK